MHCFSSSKDLFLDSVSSNSTNLQTYHPSFHQNHLAWFNQFYLIQMYMIWYDQCFMTCCGQPSLTAYCGDNIVVNHDLETTLPESFNPYFNDVLLWNNFIVGPSNDDHYTEMARKVVCYIMTWPITFFWAKTLFVAANRIEGTEFRSNTGSILKWIPEVHHFPSDFFSFSTFSF